MIGSARLSTMLKLLVFLIWFGASNGNKTDESLEVILAKISYIPTKFSGTIYAAIICEWSLVVCKRIQNGHKNVTITMLLQICLWASHAIPTNTEKYKIVPRSLIAANFIIKHSHCTGIWVACISQNLWRQ